MPRISPNPLPPTTFSCFSGFSFRGLCSSWLDRSSGETADAGEDTSEAEDDVAEFEESVVAVLANPLS
jgi:hypothetical protein